MKSQKDFFLALFPKVKEIKAKINKRDLIKFKHFSIRKETINKTKRQPLEWEKIFANDMTDKVPILKILNNSYNSVSKKQINQTKNEQKT